MTHDDHLMIIQHVRKRMDEIDRAIVTTNSTMRRHELSGGKAELLSFLQDFEKGRIAGLTVEGGGKKPGE